MTLGVEVLMVAKDASDAMRDKYKVPYRCRNCGHYFQQIFEKGHKAPSSVRCPTCGIDDSWKAIGSRSVENT